MLDEQAAAWTTPPDSIFHYTTLDGARSILENGTLRATHVQFMNDRDELVFKDEVLGHVGDLEEQEEENLSGDYGWNEVASKAYSAASHGDSLVVACFTELEDDLSMWRGYGDQGVMIEFDTDALRRVTQPSFLSRVLYVDDFRRDQDARDRVELMARRWWRGNPVVGSPALAGLQAVVKKAVWSAEREVRLVWHEHTHEGDGSQLGGPFRRMSFSVGQYGLRPHIDYPLAKRIDSDVAHAGGLLIWEPNVIRSITVGPGPFQGENVAAFEMLTRKLQDLHEFAAYHLRERYDDHPHWVQVGVRGSRIGMR
ncbi:DUF2971 domain-containing protein [Microbacterium enclense]|uniref:DUF2971 domain-containing protein n=1 Tax=Microbacterium enclense TaxID=993073 RepID=UPI003F7F93B4